MLGVLSRISYRFYSFTSRDEETALHHAAWAGQLDVVKVLLKNGADVHVTCAAGKSAMYYAAENGYERVALALWYAGASPIQKDYCDITPMSLLPPASTLAKMISGSHVPPTLPTQEDVQ
eukprot:GFKZ01001553.1.p1 GENE.GFKZ01001553.1~~GFKZ01001553.1.p1  ORF type:complete len:120 (+),score=9.40 GFKZ01001553.1:732-1091(+)